MRCYLSESTFESPFKTVYRCGEYTQIRQDAEFSRVRDKVKTRSAIIDCAIARLLPSLAFSSTVLATIFSISIVRKKIPCSPDTFHLGEKRRGRSRCWWRWWWGWWSVVRMVVIGVNLALAHCRLIVFLHISLLNPPPFRSPWTCTLSPPC